MIGLVVTGAIVGPAVYFGLKGIDKIETSMLDHENIFNLRWRDNNNNDVNN